MGWDGGGHFIRLYNWQQDRDNTIKILAARMDGEFDNYKAGLENCLTRDGQTPPTAPLPMNAQRITGLAAAIAGTDAVNLTQAQALSSEWVVEGGAVAFVANNQFKITGVDKTGTYHVGRRVRVTHNTGASTAYATVRAAVFAADTTVTLDITTLVATVTAVAFGLQDSINRSVPQGSFTKMYMAAASQALVGGVEAKVLIDTVFQFDQFTEADAVNHRITLKQAGLYLLLGGVASTNPASATSLTATIRANAATDAAYASQGALKTVFLNTFPLCGMWQGIAGDFFEIFATAGAGINISGTVNANCWLGVIRVGGGG